MSALDFSKRLNKLLERDGKSHWQLARDLHRSDSRVSEWCRGGPFMPERKNIRGLANYFNVHPAYLEYGIDSDMAKMIIELQEYEPETFEKLKQIVSLIYQINEENRKNIIPKKRTYEEILQEFINEDETDV